MDQNRVAIVEDETIVALDIGRQLRSHGYVVTGVYSSGEELLAALPTASVDIVLLDIRLGGELDGVETAQLLKTQYGLPVILLTAFGDEATLQRAKLAQPFAFILKPFDDNELRNAIVISLYRHTMEKKLHEREQLFGTILESIQDAVVVTTDDFQVRFTNSVADSLIGVTSKELIGAPLARYVDFRDASGASVSPADSVEGPLDLFRGDLASVPVRRYVVPMYTSAGERSGWVIVLNDISEQLDRERALRDRDDQLRHAQKMEAIGRLTGGIAHDFNNLLTVILGYSKLLKDEMGRIADGTPGALLDRDVALPLLEDVDGIQKAALRSAALTRQLLAFSHHQVTEHRIIDVNDAIADMEKMLQRLVGDATSLSVDPLANPATVYGDPGQLEQVIMNLVVNARDAMPGGGRISIRTDRRVVAAGDPIKPESVRADTFVVISVRDAGTGMTPDIVERIFDPFFTTKERGQGTGLGLSTVYGIVTKSGGFIDLDTAPGRGTSFSVYLPMRSGPHASASTPGDHGPRIDGTETILLVEDEESLCDLLSRVLRRVGYTVIAISNPGEALLVMESQRDTVDLIVTDLAMPHMPGTKLVERLEAEGFAGKVLYISAYPESYLSTEEIAQLGQGLLRKPVDPDLFAGRVRSILDS